MAAVLGRYARAYADVVVHHKLNADKAVEELAQIASLIQESRELRNVLQNPSVAREQKISLLDAIVKRTGGSQMMRNFLAVMIEQRRIGNVGEIIEQLKQELDRRMGIADARVSSARELTAAERKTLETQLMSVTGKTVRATYAQDKSLLGGVVVRVGSTIYDGSVLGHLERLRQEMAKA